MASLITRCNGTREIQFMAGDGLRKTVRLGRMPKKDAGAVLGKVEALAAAAEAKTSWDRQTAEWVGQLDDKLYKRLVKVGLVPKRAAAECATLGAFLESYIAGRTDVKDSTVTAWGHTKRYLLQFFGADKRLGDVTPGDAEAWRLYLAREGLAENTVRRRCGVARQFFRGALRRRLIAENPFGDMKGCAVRGNRERDYFVSREEADKVLEACPDAQWRLLFALSRFGGLRCPSEHLALRWSDVDWERGRLTIQCIKTAHHGKTTRDIPIFPELRPHLEAVREEAEPGTEFIITRYRDSNINLRTQLCRIIDKAGLTPWPKLFQNLRSTRETELAESRPLHVVCEWIGNSQRVAAQHYLQVTDEHFEQAIAQPDPQPSAGLEKAQQKAQQSEAESDRKVEHGDRPIPGMHTCTYVQVGATGLEPVTSAL